MGSDIELLVSAAKEGDKKALEELILKIQDKVYGLALRMLYNPSDAEDASQEILLKIITPPGDLPGRKCFLYLDLPGSGQSSPDRTKAEGGTGSLVF